MVSASFPDHVAHQLNLKEIFRIGGQMRREVFAEMHSMERNDQDPLPRPTRSELVAFASHCFWQKRDCILSGDWVFVTTHSTH